MHRLARALRQAGAIGLTVASARLLPLGDGHHGGERIAVVHAA
jgi:hypothetical protein